MKKRVLNIKKILKVLAAWILILAAAVGICYGVAAVRKNSYRISFYHIKTPKVESNTRIVFISDLHMQEYGEKNGSLLDEIRRLKPDLILLGGDLVNQDNDQYDSMLDFCREVGQIAPAYGVPGNHEDVQYYINGNREIFRQFKETGIHYLVNETETIEINGVPIEICGIRGNVKAFYEYGGKEMMDGMEKNDHFRIVLTHIPYLYKAGLEEYPFDLAFAGHTHGGLIRIPILGGLYSMEEGFLPEYTEGEHMLLNGAPLIIGRGMGDSSMVVPRINNRHELCIVDMNWY